MTNVKAITSDTRPRPGGPLAGALGFALLGAAVVGFWRKWRSR